MPRFLDFIDPDKIIGGLRDELLSGAASPITTLPAEQEATLIWLVGMAIAGEMNDPAVSPAAFQEWLSRPLDLCRFLN